MAADHAHAMQKRKRTEKDTGTGADPAEPEGRTQGAAAALLNGLRVLEAFTIAEPEQGVTRIAARVGLHKSTVSRILAGLAEAGYVERDPDSGLYRLGMGLIALAGPLLAGLDVRRVAAAPLRRAMEATRETTALSVVSGAHLVVVEQFDSPQFVKHTQYVGTRYNRWHSSSVRLGLAHQDPDALRELLATGALRDLPLRGSAVDQDAVDVELASVRAQGAAVNDGRTDLQEFGVSTPVLDYDGRLAAVVTISAPRSRVTAEVAAGLEAAAREAAAEISARLGAVGTPVHAP